MIIPPKEPNKKRQSASRQIMHEEFDPEEKKNRITSRRIHLAAPLDLWPTRAPLALGNRVEH